MAAADTVSVATIRITVIWVSVRRFADDGTPLYPDLKAFLTTDGDGKVTGYGWGQEINAGDVVKVGLYDNNGLFWKAWKTVE